MKQLSLLLTTLTIALLVACAPGGPAATPSPTPTALNPDDPFVRDAQAYADQLGVSLEEAVRRLGVQEALGASGLEAALRADEAATFAGLWLEHEPEFRVVVALTEGGEASIRRYTADLPFADEIEVRTARYTLAALEQAQREAIAALDALAIGATTGIDVVGNRVELEVGNPGLLLEELAAAGLALPEPVVVRAIDPDDLSPTLRAGTELYTGPEGQIIYFPVQAPTAASMAALAEGTLALDDSGCLRLRWPADGDGDPVIIWRHGFALRVDGSSVEVLDRAGEVVARAGEPVRFGGGEAPTVDIPGLPPAACPGPYWILGDVVRQP